MGLHGCPSLVAWKEKGDGGFKWTIDVNKWRLFTCLRTNVTHCQSKEGTVVAKGTVVIECTWHFIKSALTYYTFGIVCAFFWATLLWREFNLQQLNPFCTWHHVASQLQPICLELTPAHMGLILEPQSRCCVESNASWCWLTAPPTTL